MYICVNQGAIDAAVAARKTPPLPVYRAIRGTSHVESSHVGSNALLSGSCMSTELAGHKITQYDAEKNISAGIKNIGHRDFGTFRHERLQHIYDVATMCGVRDPLPGFNPIPADYSSPERFHVHYVAVLPSVTEEVVAAMAAAGGAASVSDQSSLPIPGTDIDSDDAVDDEFAFLVNVPSTTVPERDSALASIAAPAHVPSFSAVEAAPPPSVLGATAGAAQAQAASPAQAAPAPDPSSLPAAGATPISVHVSPFLSDLGSAAGAATQAQAGTPAQAASAPAPPLALPAAGPAAQARAGAPAPSRAAPVSSSGNHGVFSAHLVAIQDSNAAGRNLPVTVARLLPPDKVTARDRLPSGSEPGLQGIAAQAMATATGAPSVASTRRRLTMADLSGPVRTAAETALFHRLCNEFTHGATIDFDGFAARWNDIVTRQNLATSVVIPRDEQLKLKLPQHLQKYNNSLLAAAQLADNLSRAAAAPLQTGGAPLDANQGSDKRQRLDEPVARATAAAANAAPGTGQLGHGIVSNPLAANVPPAFYQQAIQQLLSSTPPGHGFSASPLNQFMALPNFAFANFGGAASACVFLGFLFFFYWLELRAWGRDFLCTRLNFSPNTILLNRPDVYSARPSASSGAPRITSNCWRERAGAGCNFT